MKSSVRTAAALLAALLLLALFPAPARADAPPPVTGHPVETDVYDFLRNTMEFNEAACCGILANIAAESDFNLDAVGDSVDGVHTSFGLCQWHGGRWDRLKEFCKMRGYRENSTSGQLYYIKYELDNYFPSLSKQLREVSNTADGAYDAAYAFCWTYENPAARESKAVTRGSSAATAFWTVYQPVDENAGKVSFTEESAFAYYRVMRDTPARGYPAREDNSKGAVQEGTVLYMSARCVNEAGEVYYRVSCGKYADCYLAADDLSSAEGVEDKLIVSDVSCPTRLVLGSAFTVSGSFRSPISGITYASVTILDSQGQETGVGKSVKLNRTEYSLLSLDAAVKFGKIPAPGTYIYRVEVRNASDTYLLEQEFTVVPVVSVTVTLDPQGGLCDTSSLELASGAACGTLPTPSREGYDFVGWYTAPQGGSQVTEKTKLTGEEDLTLYARWSVPAPTELTAAALEEGGVRLQWTAAPNASGYVIYYRNRGYIAWNEYGSAQGAEAAVTGLPNGAEYEFSLRSFTGDGSDRALSARRSNVAQALMLTAPATPSLQEPVREAGGVTVRWTESAGATGYYLEYTAEEGSWSKAPGLVGSSVRLTELDDTKSYRFRLQAYCSYGSETRFSEFSEERALGPKSLAPSPRDLEVQTGEEGTVSLSWTGSGAESYEVLYRAAGESGWTRGPTVTETTARISGLKDRRVYEFVVYGLTSINGEARRAESHSDAVTAAVFRAPAAPEGLEASREGDGIRVLWQAAPNAVSYELDYRAENGEWQQVALTETAWVLSPVKEAKAYHFRVRALGSFQGYTKRGAYSGETVVKAKPVAEAPGGLQATPQEDGSVKLQWNAAAGADGYRVSYREIRMTAGEESGRGEWRELDPTESLRETVADLTPLCSYEFRVASYTLLDGRRTYSEGYSASATAPSLVAPGAPGELRVERCTGSALHVTWGAAENATEYELIYRVDSGEEQRVTGLRSPEYTLEGLDPGTPVKLWAAGVARVGDASLVGERCDPKFTETGRLPEETAASPDFRWLLGSDGGIYLSWEAVPGCDGYRVYYARVLSEPEESLRTGAVFWADTRETALTLPQLEDGAAYRVSLHPFRQQGEEIFPFAAAAASLEAVSLREPDPPSGLSARRGEGDSVELNWRGRMAPLSYDLQYSSDGVNWKTVTGLNGADYVLEGVTPETRCFLRMRSVRTLRGVTATGIYGSTLFLRAKGETTAPMSARCRDDGGLELRWETAPGADGYRVYSRMAADREGAALREDTWRMSEFVTGDHYTLTGLERGCVYELRIFAYRDQGGVKTLLEEYSAGTMAPSLTPPPSPQGVRAVLGQNGVLSVTWQPSEGANRYLVAYSADGLTWNRAISLSETGCELQGLSVESGYTVRVWAAASLMGCSRESAPVEVLASLED